MSDNPYERDQPGEQDSDPTATTPDTAARPEPAPVTDDPVRGEPTDAHRDAGAPVVDGPVEAPDHAPREAAPDEPREPLGHDHSAHEPSAADPGPATAPLPVTEDERAVDAVERDRTSGTHGATRPVPRSGLTEHRSAGYLTGDLAPPERAETDDEPRTAGGSTPAGRSWLTGGGVGAAAAAGASEDSDHREHAERTTDTAERPRTERDVVLDGSTAHTRPPSRAGAHVWAVLLTLLLTPVAWYLIADAGARLTLAPRSPWETGNLNIAALLELGGGLLVLVAVLLVARWSSLGAILTGSLVLIVGVPFVAVPTWTQEVLEPVQEWLDGLGDFGANVAHHLVASGSTGRLVVVGVALILVGVVSHGARRQGRREVRPLSETV